MSDTREPGFYWVEERGKLRDPIVAEWSRYGSWYICGYDGHLTQSEIYVLSDRLNPPETPT